MNQPTTANDLPESVRAIFAAFKSWMDYRMNTPSAMDNLPPEEWMEGMMLQSFLAGVSTGAILTQHFSVEELRMDYISGRTPGRSVQ